MNTQYQELSAPTYLYNIPMFMITVSTVLIVDNGIVLVKDSDQYRFPGGVVKAGQETIQFAAIRHIKEQLGVVLKKDLLIPADFRSDPERSHAGNVVDIGMVCITENLHPDNINGKWVEVNFESKRVEKEQINWYMDHEILLERALTLALLMR